MFKKHLIALSSFCLLFNAHVSQAETDTGYFQQTMGLHVGYFFTDIDSNARLSGSLAGSELNFSTDLGLNNRTNTFISEVFWRITPKHRLDFTWFGLYQKGEKLSHKEFIINDNIIPAGTGLQTNFNHNRYQLTYTYNLFQGSNYETGPSLGIYTLSLNSSISSVIANTVKKTYSSKNITIPLPIIGWRGSYGVTDSITLHSHFNFMIVSINDWSGDLYDFQLSAEYNFWKYMGVGLAYNLSFLEVNNTSETSAFQYNYDFQGVQTYLKFAF
ncbi:MAG: hypothetical protein GQ581_00580 [Methyloprofundus sp.]|nr:hypothetical protein [Methyloprofundus sp.]